MKVTLRQLRVFDAVATLGSVTAAASHLHMSQSTASGILTDLQFALGRQLFAGSRGKPLRITDEGRRLHPMVRSLLGGIGEIERKDVNAPLAGKLVIGATAMIAETVLPRLCVEFMQLHPGVRILIEVESVVDLFERLARLEIETALIETFPTVEGVEVTRWRTDELVLVVAADHPLAGRDRLAFADLAGFSWCTREARSPTTIRLRDMVQERAGAFDVALEATSNWAVRHAAIAGGGIACLSKSLVQFDIENGRLSRLDVDGFAFSRSLSLARPAKIWRSQLTRSFDRFLLERGD